MAKTWVHFLLIGAALMALHRATAPPPPRRIDAGSEVVAGLRQEQRRRTGTLPTAEEERALVQRYIDSEILVREALARGLDRGDQIVRRRLVQRMEFLLEADADREAPTDDELATLLAEEGSRLAQPPRLSFEHVFVARDRHPDARAHAMQLRARIAAGDDARALGDPFARGRRFEALSVRAVADAFGDAFAAALGALPEATWSSPIESSFGFHLVRISARAAAAGATVAEARAPLERLWVERRRAALRSAGLERLRRRYEVVR
jgi:hypothetical protein